MAEQYLYAVVLGLLLGVLLDFFRFFRLLFNDRFFFDFFYWIISAVCVFCYLIIFNNGEIRILIILEIFSSVAFYALTFAKLTENIQKLITGKIRKWSKNCFKKVKKVLKSMYNIYYNNKVRFRNVKTTENKGEVYDRKEKQKK